MPLLTGGSLAELVREGPLPPRVAADIVRQVAEAVQYAHKKGIIHRDLKPGNILLARRDGVESASRETAEPGAGGLCPRVTDFGLARMRESGGLSVTGEALGTPSYMPPEQARGQMKLIGPASDVYGLGAVLYCLLTGRPPFQSDDPIDTMCQVCAEDPVPPRQLNAKIPRDLETICLKCLHKEPSHRYSAAGEMANELHRWETGQPILARPVGRLERAVKWVRRRPVVAGLMAALVVALVAGATVSVAFGLHARQKELLAAQKEKDAREALEDVQDQLAIGLLRTLGHFKKETALNDFELEALEDLASLPGEQDLVRIRFLVRALEKPERSAQLGLRLEESVIAAVGLRQDLHQQAMDIAAERLVDSSALHEVKVVCARLLAELNCQQISRVVTAAETIVVEMARETDPNSLRALSAAFAGLAGKLPAKQAAKQVSILASRIVELTAKTTDPDSLGTLSAAFAALAGKLPAEQAAKQASILASRIVELAAKTNNPHSLRALSEAFAALASKLPAEQAGKQARSLVNQIVERAAMTTDPYPLRDLSDALAAVAGKLPAEQASSLASRIVELAATTDPHSLRALSEAFAALAGKLPADQAGKQASSLASRIVELAAKTNNPHSLRALSKAFATLPGKRKESQVSTLVSYLARRSHEDRTALDGLGALDRLLPLLGTQSIVDSLKEPGCVGTTRATILKHLGQRYKRSFSDVWELVDYLKQHDPKLDLDSPLQPARFVPRPGEMRR
jgi:hypothetical protein